MRRIFCFIIACILVCSLSGCKKSPSFSETSDNTSVVSVDSSEQTQTGSEHEAVSSDVDETQETSSEASSTTVSGSSSDSSSSKPTTADSKPSAGVTPPKTSTTQTTTVLLTAETSRAPSTDIGSIVEDGYIYYFNPRSDFPSGLFRKKISGGPEETILNESISNVKVLNGKVYYLTKSNNLYRCDINGKNIITLDNSGKVNSFEVAGNWIFVTRSIGSSIVQRIQQELYVISTDGSKIQQIKPNVKNDAGSTVVIHGFNRGYCYLTVTYEYFIKGSSSNITWTSENIKRRIDYRSAELTQCNLKINANYTYDGKSYYGYDNFGDHSLYYDHILQALYPQRIMVSLVKNTAVKVEENVMAVGSSRLRDYYVYEAAFNSPKEFKLYFVDFNGTEKSITLDLSDNGIYDSCAMYSVQDIHNNQLLIQRSSSKTNAFGLLMVSPDGAITEIYCKAP